MGIGNFTLWGVALSSSEFGYEEFKYFSKQDADRAFRRLKRRAKAYEKKDGIARTVHAPFRIDRGI